MIYLKRCLASAFLFFLFACQQEDVLEGFDKKKLFAEPTAEEINKVKEEWLKRDLSPLDFKVEQTHKIISDSILLKIISFRLMGMKQYAGVMLPITTKPLPIQLYVYGFALDNTVTYQNLTIEKSNSETSTLPFVYVVPALRGQSLSLTINGTEYTSPKSEGTRNDAFDGATDDAIACLNAVTANFSEVDPDKVFVRGGSRGGTVALLMAERDKRVKLSVGIAFPTDLIELTSTHQNDPTYKFQFLDALIDGTSSVEETRIKMIAGSPLYFYNQLPKTQMHFGDQDDITPAKQGKKLFDQMKESDLEQNIEFFIYKKRSHHNIGLDNLEMENRIRKFFEQI
ncbi:MAG TPA: prolyl oligopeptidase family serine peptidase [Cytophagales bacterium]|nr:prolyl oligopeptidase family serine peptidase [Cytophagales bacterium]